MTLFCGQTGLTCTEECAPNGYCKKNQRLQHNIKPAEDKKCPPEHNINETLTARGQRYGDFTDNALVSQSLKAWLVAQDGWTKLDPVKREALEMIAQKIARILNGDPEYKDNWHDIAGYATLAEERCNEMKENVT